MLNIKITNVSRNFLKRINMDAPEALQDSRVSIETYEDHDQELTDVIFKDTYGFEIRELPDNLFLEIKYDGILEAINEKNRFRILLINRSDFEKVEVL